jgi:cyclic pyranopterin phosphate synthase
MSEAGVPHLNEAGEAHMVDVGDKEMSRRRAVAEGTVRISPDLADRVFGGELPKGDAAAVARLAGIMAAKKTPDLVPLAHPLPLDSVEVEVARSEEGARVVATVSTTARTGVEMEAMTAVAAACLSLYDMVKGLERGVEIGPIRLVSKEGGRSGSWRR